MKSTAFQIFQSRRLAWGAIACVGALAFGGEAVAQSADGPTVFTIPDELCTWDWSGPVTPWLMAELKRQNLLAYAAVEIAKTCPETLCNIQWDGYSVPEEFQDAGQLPDEMLCELSHRQIFFEEVIGEISAVCPDVAQTMVDRAPSVYEECGSWPRLVPPEGSPLGGGVPPQPGGDDVNDDTAPDTVPDDIGQIGQYLGPS